MVLTFSDTPLSRFQLFTLCWRKLTSLEYQTKNILVIPWTLRQQGSTKRRSLCAIPYGIVYQNTETSYCVCLFWFVLSQKFSEVHDIFSTEQNGLYRWCEPRPVVCHYIVPRVAPCAISHVIINFRGKKREGSLTKDQSLPHASVPSLPTQTKKIANPKRQLFANEKIWVELWGKNHPWG